MATKTKKKSGVNYEKYVDESKAALLDQIDEQLMAVDEKLKKYQPLIDHKKSLESSKRALLGGSRLTSGNNGMRLMQEDVVRFLEENPGQTVKEMQEEFGVPYTTINSHLLRGKDERFLQKNKKWYVRDPENGVDTVEDIEEEDE